MEEYTKILVLEDIELSRDVYEWVTKKAHEKQQTVEEFILAFIENAKIDPNRYIDTINTLAEYTISLREFEYIKRQIKKVKKFSKS
ncbi:hypothetical protein DRN41_03540 [Thermococci archaeon]|nr:MAG: hypothetical protein DRI61_09250 [Chloroflexota bacterium]RLF85840.1 MAG: hypothetical protein DRN41_03540 [Thermococci archaeon]